MKFYYHFLMIMLMIVQGGFAQSQSDIGSPIQDSLFQMISPLTPHQQIDSLGSWCWSYREKNPDLAINVGLKAIDLAEKTNNAAKRTQISNYLGVIYLHYKFDYTSALPYLQRAFRLAISTGDSLQLAYAYNNLGDAYYLANNNALALDYGFKSLELFSELKDTAGICYSFVNLGLAYKANDKPELAINYFKQAIRFGELTGNNNTIAYAMLEMGHTLKEQDSLEQAQVFLTDSYLMHEEMGNIIYAGYCLSASADILFSKGELQEAFNHYLLALEKQEIRNHQLGIAQNKLKMAIIYSLWNQKDKGEKELFDAIEICKRLKLPKELLNAYHTLADFYVNLGEKDEAIKQFEFFLTETNRLFNDLQFELLRETEKLIENEVELSTAADKMHSKNTLQAALLLILLLFIIVVILLISKYRTSRQHNLTLFESNVTKDKLFSIIAHDLRKPLVSLIQSIELLNENELDEAKKNRLIKSLSKQTESTYSLLENLLSLSASKTGKLPFKPQNNNIQEIIKEQWELLKPEADKKRIQMNTTLHTSTVFADKEMIRLVIRNILSNAVKYSENGNSITIVSKKVDHQVIITVRDQGVGMNLKTLNSLFKSELVNSSPGTAGEKGTGIGLSLCHEFVEKHGGRIAVQSEPEQGAEFSLFFPEK